MNVIVNNEQTCDADMIREVTQEAFRGQEHTSGREADIVDQLRTAGALSISLVARCEDRVVGHVAVSPVETESAEPGWYGVGPVSVHPSFQRKGIGSMLMHAAVGALRDNGARGCVLVGHPEYYQRFGFRSDGSATVAGVPAEVTFCLMLTASRAPGAVTFHKAFGVD